jgi:anti-anti-sigma factor
MKFMITDSGKFKVVHIEGDLLINKRYDEINKSVLKLIKEGHHHFVFNLEKLSCIDSSGISVFINCLCDVQESNGSIYMIVPDPEVREIIELVGLNRLIKTYQTEADFNKEHLA